MNIHNLTVSVRNQAADPEKALEMIEGGFLNHCPPLNDTCQSNLYFQTLCNICSALTPDIPLADNIVSALYKHLPTADQELLFSLLACFYVLTSCSCSSLVSKHPLFSTLVHCLDSIDTEFNSQILSSTMNSSHFTEVLLTKNLFSVLDFELLNEPSLELFSFITTQFCSLTNHIISLTELSISHVRSLFGMLSFLSRSVKLSPSYCSTAITTLSDDVLKVLIQCICLMTVTSASKSLTSHGHKPAQNYSEVIGIPVVSDDSLSFLRSYRSLLVCLTVNVIASNHDLINDFLLNNSWLPSLLTFMNIEEKSPFTREWVVLLLRFISANEKVQRYLEGLSPIEVQNSPELRQMGISAEIVNGEVELNRMNQKSDVIDLEDLL
ncbi:hypothetical protein GEMRC1_007019 [Eukaryota sp. GEM-RC1]